MAIRHRMTSPWTQGCMERGLCHTWCASMSLDERFDELARRHAEAELGGGEERIRRQHKAGKKTARERLDSCSTRPLHRDRQVRRPIRATTSAWTSRDSRVTSRHRLGTHPRPPGVRLSLRISRSSEAPSRGYARKICKDHGPGHEDGHASRGPQRLRRRANPGASSRWPGTPTSSAEHAGVRRRAPDLRGPRSVRRRRRVLAGHHRLRLHVKNTSYMFVTGPDVIKAVTTRR